MKFILRVKMESGLYTKLYFLQGKRGRRRKALQKDEGRGAREEELTAENKFWLTLLEMSSLLDEGTLQ